MTPDRCTNHRSEVVRHSIKMERMVFSHA